MRWLRMLTQSSLASFVTTYMVITLTLQNKGCGLLTTSFP